MTAPAIPLARPLVALRVALLTVLVLTTVGPLTLLLATSVGDAWFFPALRPAHWSADAWRSAFVEYPLVPRSRRVGPSVLARPTTHLQRLVGRASTLGRPYA